MKIMFIWAFAALICYGPGFCEDQEVVSISEQESVSNELISEDPALQIASPCIIPTQSFEEQISNEALCDGVFPQTAPSCYVEGPSSYDGFYDSGCSEMMPSCCMEEPVCDEILCNDVCPQMTEPCCMPLQCYEQNNCFSNVCGSFCTDLALLYWNAHEEGLDYVVLSIYGDQPPTAPSLDILTVDSNRFQPGFRIGLGYEKPSLCSKWDLWASYTCFYTTQSDSTNQRNATEMVPLFVNPASDARMGLDTGKPVASAKWKLHFNTFDVEMGYSNFPGNNSRFGVRSRLGVRGAWIHQQLNADYKDVFFSAAPSTITSIATTNKNDFDGVGLRVGTDLHWNVWGRFGLFGSANASLLWGHYKVSQRSVYTAPLTIGDMTYPAGTQRNIDHFSFHQIVPAIDLSAGMTWTTCCNWKCFNGFDFTLGWEFQVWFSQNQLHQVIDSGINEGYVNMRGNLSLQGLVARLGTCF